MLSIQVALSLLLDGHTGLFRQDGAEGKPTRDHEHGLHTHRHAPNGLDPVAEQVARSAGADGTDRAALRKRNDGAPILPVRRLVTRYRSQR